MIKFNKKNLKKFKTCYPKAPSQGPVGRAPKKVLQKTSIPSKEWPKKYSLEQKIDRDTIREICQRPSISEKAAYVCAMAWGGATNEFCP